MIENPMVLERHVIPTTQVYTVQVKAIVTATIKVTADDEEEIDGKIDYYEDSIMGNIDNFEIDSWDVIFSEDAEEEYYD
ncbi:hypothetical protein HNR45_000669 [Negativicoccus succinicivorans]|uniref:Uncharacterized protein n=1 Tax=Negativicoccus succinicivorans TaxID=620903 RepID=A0A841R1H1_9FIRM|nr:hypothetical protein [Negativicoccus succinicivorans]MBB6477636.1 hypothetical protein [Negativicoccus succinicivorans]